MEQTSPNIPSGSPTFPKPWLGVAFLVCVSLMIPGSAAYAAGLQTSQVLVLVNKDTSISSQVAKMYQSARGIPAANILSLSMGTQRQITPEQYWKIAPEVRKALEANPQIRCVLTTSGVPYTIQSTDGKDEGAAFDNQLALVLIENPGDRKRHQPNPLFVLGANTSGQADVRARKMVMVARLDGPDLKTITRMVEDAIAVEKTGLQGPVYGDAQGHQTITGYGAGDATIRHAMDRLSGAGFKSKLDTQQASWKKPASGPGDQAAGAAFYVGWYDLLDFQDIFGAQGLARGSIAWHIASQEAQNIWDPGKGWAMNLMKRGVAVTLGPVREPYVDAFPVGAIFTEALLSGASVAESYWLALPHTSWAMVLLGDPVYAPFSIRARPSLIARAYVADNAKHILEKGQTAALLVQIECVGPAGSGTPAMTATVEPEFGLADASGTVNIPAMQAGSSITVRIPKVTANDDPSGMFRVALLAEDAQKQTRRIVLEGRNGFSRLTGGALPKSQLFVRGDASQIMAGQPGLTFQIDPATLTGTRINLPQGFAVVGAAYAPNGGPVALAALNPQENKGGTLFVDPKTGVSQPVPAGMQFVRWLEKDEVLLKSTTNKLVRHSLSGGADQTYGVVPGCPGAVGSSVIPGTDIYFTSTPEGKVCIQNGSEPPVEAMVGTQATKFGAVANDLSVFGGVDEQKQMWVQHGLNAKPEVVATGVERVLWGPISRRALVVDGKVGRIYDGRTRTWVDLGVVSAAQWSPNEERLIFTDAGENPYLSIMIGTQVQKLVPMSILGSLTGIALTDNGDKAFMLSGITGGLDAWMMALPPAK